MVERVDMAGAGDLGGGRHLGLGHRAPVRPVVLQAWPAPSGAAVIDIDDVDLAKALDRLSKLAARLARDIPLELDSSERTHAIAGVMEDAARLLRARAYGSLPKVVELESVERLTEADRLSAAVAFLAYQLTLVAQEMRAGQFEQADRSELADTLTTLARDLCPQDQPTDFGDSGGR